MAYGSALVDNIQSSTANTPVVFKDGNGTQIGTLCRAWVNFDGTGTPSIRASFNVSSITDNGTGDYTVNFANALPDANYSFNVTQGMTALTTCVITGGSVALAPATTTSRRFGMYSSVTGSATDMAELNVAVFR